MQLVDVTRHESVHNQTHGEAIRSRRRRDDALFRLFDLGPAVVVVVMVRERLERVVPRIPGSHAVYRQREAQLEAIRPA